MTTNTGFAAQQSAKRFFLGGLALMLGFSKGEELCGEREGWLPGKLDTFHQRHLGGFLSYSFLR